MRVTLVALNYVLCGFAKVAETIRMDISQLTNEVAALVSQLRVQFEDGQCFHLPTYTKSCLDFLEGNPPMMVMHGGDARELRVDQAAKTRCLKVMKDGSGGTIIRVSNSNT